LLWIVLGGLVLVVAYWGLLFLAQRSMLFPAPALAGAPERPPDVRHFAHDNGEVTDLWPEAFAEPRGWGVGVLLVEYPGYGRSAGRPSEASIAETMLAVHDWAGREPGVDAGRIVVYRRSLGAGAVCGLAARRPVRAVVLESAFESVRVFAAGYGAPPFLVRDPFDNLAFARGYRGPLLLLHGSRDRIIPARHSQALAHAAPQAEFHLLPCGHNDCPRPWPQVRGFLDRHGILRLDRPDQATVPG